MDKPDKTIATSVGQTEQERGVSGRHFLFRGALCIWQPHSRGFQFILEDDLSKTQICQDSLLRRGLSFESLDDLVLYAQRAGWPDWNRIVDSYLHVEERTCDQADDESIVS